LNVSGLVRSRSFRFSPLIVDRFAAAVRETAPEKAIRESEEVRFDTVGTGWQRLRNARLTRCDTVGGAVVRVRLRPVEADDVRLFQPNATPQGTRAGNPRCVAQARFSPAKINLDPAESGVGSRLAWLGGDATPQAASSEVRQVLHYDVEIRRVIDLQHECDREPERPLPASRPGPCRAQLGLAETVALKGPMLPDVSTARTRK
jgi:hypothetical protein